MATCLARILAKGQQWTKRCLADISRSVARWWLWLVVTGCDGNAGDQSADDFEEMWELHVWDPPAFFLNTRVLTQMFLAMVSDREEVFSQVYQEYNKNFVHPRLFCLKED
ncbi:hypothetical protein EV182_007413, partial [Spiromyces aspiralis]